MTERTITLHCTAGNSDKLYIIFVRRDGDGWRVDYQNGRRGGTMTPGTRTPTPVDYAAADAIATKLLKSKLAKDYRPIDCVGGGFAATACASDKVDSGFRPQLLNPVDERTVAELLADDDWFAQIKFDGERRTIRLVGGQVEGINRKGQVVPLPIEVATCVGELLHGPANGDTLIDGELIGTTFCAFDLLMFNGRDLRERPAIDRVAALMQLIGDQPSPVVKGTPAVTAAAKRALLDFARANGEEGIVFKRAAAPYRSDRPNSGGDALKFKLVESCSVRVAGITPGKRSVQMQLLDAGGQWIDVGRVTVPPNHGLPAEGAVVEVCYLYAFPMPGGALFQPVYLGPRSDIDLDECRVSQLKFKGEAKAA